MFLLPTCPPHWVHFSTFHKSNFQSATYLLVSHWLSIRDPVAVHFCSYLPAFFLLFTLLGIQAFHHVSFKKKLIICEAEKHAHTHAHTHTHSHASIYTKKEREWDCESTHFHPLLYSSNAHDGWAWAGLTQTEAGNSIQVSHLDNRNPITWAINSVSQDLH